MLNKVTHFSLQYRPELLETWQFPYTLYIVDLHVEYSYTYIACAAKIGVTEVQSGWNTVVTENGTEQLQAQNLINMRTAEIRQDQGQQCTRQRLQLTPKKRTFLGT